MLSPASLELASMNPTYADVSKGMLSLKETVWDSRIEYSIMFTNLNYIIEFFMQFYF